MSKLEAKIKLCYNKEIKVMDYIPKNFQDLKNFFIKEFQENSYNNYNFYFIDENNNKNQKEITEEIEYFNEQIKNILNQNEHIIYATIDTKSSFSIFNDSNINPIYDSMDNEKNNFSEDNKKSKIFINDKNIQKDTPTNNINKLSSNIGTPSNKIYKTEFTSSIIDKNINNPYEKKILNQ